MKLKIGTKVNTPDGSGIIRKNEKWSLRQGFKCIRFYFPGELKNESSKST